MKILKWAVIIVVVLVVAIFLGVWLGLDGIVRKTVETQATSSLNLPTTLAGANVSIFGQSLSLSDLQISSPQGFSSPKMFTLGGAKVGVSVSQLRADPIGVQQIVIDKPVLSIEQANGKFNFQVLLNNPSKSPAEAGSPSSQPMKLVIHELQINSPQVVIRPGIPGLNNEITIPIPSFDLKEIGNSDGNQNGVAIRQVVMEVIGALVQKTTESDLLPPEVKQLLSLNLAELKTQLQSQVTQQIGNLTKGVKLGGDTGKSATDAIGKGLGGLLDQGKKDKKSD